MSRLASLLLVLAQPLTTALVTTMRYLSKWFERFYFDLPMDPYLSTPDLTIGPGLALPLDEGNSSLLAYFDANNLKYALGGIYISLIRITIVLCVWEWLYTNPLRMETPWRLHLRERQVGNRCSQLGFDSEAPISFLLSYIYDSWAAWALLWANYQPTSYVM
jgi:hypothetical protein